MSHIIGATPKRTSGHCEEAWRHYQAAADRVSRLKASFAQHPARPAGGAVMSGKAFITTRAVTTEECPWLDDDVPADFLLHQCTSWTYGVISSAGVAVTRDPDGGYPFFEIPRDAVRVVGVDGAAP